MRVAELCNRIAFFGGLGAYVVNHPWFHRVHLGLSSTWPPTVTGPEPIPVDARPARLSLATSRIEEFYALLLANTTLGTYVRHLDVGLPPRDRRHAASESQGSDTGGVLAHDLPAILDLLPSLTSLGVTNHLRAKVCRWTALPPQLQEAIARCCTRQSIRKLGFAEFYDFPYTLFMAPPNLEELYLSYVFEPEAKVQPVVVRRPQHLKTVSMVDYGSPVVEDLLQEDPEAFSEVVTIIWNIQNQVDVDVLGRLFQLCVTSLQEVNLEFGVMLPWGDATNFDALKLMPPIKRLCLSSHIHLPNIEDSEGEHFPFGLSYDLRLFQSLLQTQHQLDVLEVKVGLSTYNNFSMTHNLPSRILHKRKAWKAFDEYLASPLSSDLPAPIGIHVNVTWCASESHEPWSGKERVFRGALQREMRVRLKRSSMLNSPRGETKGKEKKHE
ncbi:hypothetical protein D9611_013174 [Ephemerocybe angulata]|uniref:Uncharacterized protein n=1 Tax=Ephemerocybe angulata TaxID=980116 RepID=A0A8H5FA63_9AGAR|nr:hypothetical protein D9611_013174 [Tulosesus angulatus]